MVLLNPQYPDGEEPSSPRRRCSRSAATTRPSPSTTRRRTGTRGTRRRTRTGRSADKALSDAIVLRLGLGQEDEAIADAKQFKKNYGTRTPTRRRRSRSRSARTTPTRKTGTTRARRARGAMGIIDKAPPDIQVQAHATLARALHAPQGERGQAQGEYAKVRKLWATARRRRRRSTTPTRARTTSSALKRLGKALDAVGEAYFFAAEERKKDEGRCDRRSPCTRAREQGRRQEVHRQVADALGSEEEGGHRGGRAGVPEDPRAPAGAAAALGHRRRLARRPDVGRLRRRLPRALRIPRSGKKGFVPGTGDTLSWNEVKATTSSTSTRRPSRSRRTRRSRRSRSASTTR